MEQILPLLPLLAILAIFWLLVLRPARKRQQETARMQASLQPGDRVMLAAGIFATVISLEDERARVRVADGVELEVVRAAIGGVEREEPAA